MAKDKETKRAEKAKEELEAVESKKENKTKTFCWLKSKANYIIEIKDGEQIKFIQPFGKVKVIKETLSFINNADASYLTFVKA